MASAGDSRVHSALRGLHLLALVVWFGGAVTLLAAVAPGAFNVLPNTKLAGAVVGHVLRFLDWLAIFATPYLVVTALLDERARGNPTAQWVRAAVLAIFGVAAVISRFVIVPRMEALRAAPDFTGERGAAWSGKAEFGMLHGLSSTLMLVAALCALIALWFAARRRPLADALEAEDRGDDDEDAGTPKE